MSKKTALTEAEREVLYARTGGYCEWCGRPMELWEMVDHHRKLRSRGGGWEMSNQMGVHGSNPPGACHNLQPGSIHQEVALATARGAMVHAWQDPKTTDVLLASGHTWALWRLNDDGTKLLIDLPF